MKILLIPLTAVGVGLYFAADKIPGLNQYTGVPAPEAVAIGNACAQAGKSLEQCFKENPTAPRAAMLDGWKEMQTYLQEQKAKGAALPEKAETTAAQEPTKETAAQ